jgi:putative addiction module antidote
MSKPLKIRKIGTSLGVVLPKELLTELGVGEGDTLYPVRTPDGVSLSPYDPKFAEILDDSRDYMRRHRNAMRELAK